MGIYIIRDTNGNVSSLQEKPQIGDIELDASISETHSFSAEAPQFTVETGSTISDNIINLPIKLSMTAVVSTVGGDPYRADEAFKQLLDIRDNKETITVVTSAKVYENMILISLEVQRSKSVGQKLQFTANFIEVTFADAEVVTIDKIKTVPKKAAPKKVEAEQPKEDVPPTMEELMKELEGSYYTPVASSTGVAF